MRLEGAGAAKRVREVLLTGDLFVSPPRVIFDLEAALRGVPASDVGGAVERFFAAVRPEILTVPPEVFRDTVEAAVAKGASD